MKRVLVVAAVIDGLYERFRFKSVVHCGPGEEKLGADIEKFCKHKPVATHDALRDLHQLKPIADSQRSHCGRMSLQADGTLRPSQGKLKCIYRV